MRTIFNLLGPLTNPAGARHQLIGVYDAALVEPMAHALGRLGSEHALVVHGDGLDEFSPNGATDVAELRGGEVKRYQLRPRDFGLGDEDPARPRRRRRAGQRRGGARHPRRRARRRDAARWS